MAQRCTVCTHPKRTEIDRTMVGQRPSYQDVADRYRVTLSSLYRHACEHLPERLLQAQEVRDVADADALLNRVEMLLDKLNGVIERAETGVEVVVQQSEHAAQDMASAVRTLHRSDAMLLSAIREYRPTLELLAKLLGKIQDTQVVNVLINPQWLTLQGLIVEALADYPEAKAAVLNALNQLPQST